MSASPEALELIEAAAKAAEDVKADNLVAFDVSERLPLADVFFLASGNSERQVTAIAERIDEDLSKAGHPAVRREGVREGRWALLDFNNIIVHVMHHEDRVYYELERLWKDCPAVKLGDET